jgi:tetratricopeptide (TPR) repeat protein
MKKFLVLLFMLFTLSGFPKSGEEVLPLPDSLVGRLRENRKVDERRAEALNAVIMYYVDEHRILEAETYINELAALSDEFKDDYWKALSLYYKSLCAGKRYNYSEFLPLINESLRITETLRETKRTQLLLTQICLVKSAYYLHINQFPDCQNYIERGLELAEKNGFDQQKKDILNNKAILLTRTKKVEEGIALYKKLLAMDDDVIVLLNLASAFQQLEQYDSSLFYLDSIIRYAPKADNREIIVTDYLIKAYQVKEQCYLYLEQWDNALQCLNESEMLIGFDDKQLAINYLHRSIAYHGKDQFKAALSLIDTTISFSRKIEEVELERYAIDVKSSILKNMKDYEKEAENLRYFIALTDTINRRENLLKVQEQQYQHEAQVMEQKYELQRQALRNRQLIIIILASVFVIIAILVAIIIWLNRKRLASELELRNREITAKTMDKMQSNEMLNEIIEKLTEKERHPEKNVLPGAIHDLKTLVDADTKKDFDQYFVKVHPDFYEKLKADFPNLTQNELRLCAYLKMNLNTKDIAAICNITPESARVARSRLRKSLNLIDSNINLASFLSKY